MATAIEDSVDQIRLRWVVVAVLVTALFAVAPVTAAPFASMKDVCKRVSVSDPINPSQRPVWVESRSQILTASRSGVIGLLASGKNAGTDYSHHLAKAFSQVGEDEYLRFGYDRSEGKVKAEWLDRELTLKGAFSLFDSAPESEIQVYTPMDWAVTKGNEDQGDFLVGYGGYTMSSGTRHQGESFFYQELHRPEMGKRGLAQLVNALFATVDERYYLLEGTHYFASIGPISYFFKMQGGMKPELYAFEPGAENPQPILLTGYPGENRKLPEFTDDIAGPGEYLKKRQNQIDKVDMIHGIYSYGELLYLLAKSPTRGWELTQLQIVRDDLDKPVAVEAKGTMRIPSAARALSVLPTASQWFVFEHPYMEKSATNMLSIPAKVIKSFHQSPLYGSGKNAIECASR